MGRFSSKYLEPSKIIVLLEWKSSPQTPAPHLQFWILDCPADSQPQQSLPIPAAVPGRIDELGPRPTQTDSRGSRVYLPPLLAYDGRSSSITMHNLAVSGNVDVEFIQWGPGIRLTQTQAMGRLFNGAPTGLCDAKYLSPAGAMRSDVSDELGDRRASAGLMTVIAMDNSDGTVDIKYRTKRLGRNSFSPLSINEAYRAHEQTIRTVARTGTSDLGFWPPSMSNIPVHVCSVGHRERYLLIVTLCQNRDKTMNLLSLHMLNEQMAFSEASTMSEPNEDRGLRWQMQTFEIPIQVSNVAPLVVETDRTTYLLFFYFDKGALHYARIKYAGSGFFTDFVDKIPCLPAKTEEARPSAHAPIMNMRSRWSLLFNRSSYPQDSDPQPSTEHDCKEPRDDFLPLGAEGCQPYVLIANGHIWIFYEGADMDGKYVRHKITRDVDSFSEGWEAVSWATNLHTAELGKAEEAGVSRHFIPVLVPGDFMTMQ